MMDLTPREQKVLNFLRSHVEAHGVSPSYDEIVAGTGIASKSNVAYILDTLAWRKYIRRATGRARNIELLQTEDYHIPKCDCDGCARARYLADLKLVQALQVVPKFAGCVEFIGLRPLSHLTRTDWAYIDNSRVRRKPLLGCAKTAKNTFHQHSSRSV